MPKTSMPEQPDIILASGSAARRQMLKNAGVAFEAVPAAVDEEHLKTMFVQPRAAESAVAIARGLALAKASAVWQRNPLAIVIGSDQTLCAGDSLLTKARSNDEARDTLLKLRGTAHVLHSAVCVIGGRAGGAAWQHHETAHVHMRSFSDEWLESYLSNAGDALTSSVGCYKLEGAGIQLFEKMDGDYFTVLGMPLLPLLGELRRRGAIA